MQVKDYDIEAFFFFLNFIVPAMVCKGLALKKQTVGQHSLKKKSAVHFKSSNESTKEEWL